MRANELELLRASGVEPCLLMDNGGKTGRLPFSEAALALRPGVNLLRNSNFIRKELVVNQRGRDAYEGAGYGIDGWKSTGSKSVQTLEEDGWVIHDTDGGEGQYRQVIEESEAIALNGVDLTASILVHIQTAGAFQFGLFSSAYHATKAPIINAGTHLLSYTTIMTDITSTLQYFISPRATNAKVIACKLEQGDHQTLAHQDTASNCVLNDQPPNKALELSKCQRYFYKSKGVYKIRIAQFDPSTSKVWATVPTPVAMRTRPVITSIGESTLYDFHSVGPNVIDSFGIEDYSENGITIWLHSNTIGNTFDGFVLLNGIEFDANP